MHNIYDFLNTNKDCQLLIVSDDKQAQIASDIASFKKLKPFVLADFMEMIYFHLAKSYNKSPKS